MSQFSSTDDGKLDGKLDDGTLDDGTTLENGRDTNGEDETGKADGADCADGTEEIEAESRWHAT